ncbi:hypothetical protein J5I95_16625 [Candidatus Poribacteria bacterium]|nr:hypothetical protein [Candidatus Poribacteria bacterium]
MKNGFDGEQDLSQASVKLRNNSLKLSARQVEIYRNLEAIGPEIAAYYLDGLKILHSKDLENATSFLAHAAREIDGGLRDILSVQKKEELEFVIRVPNREPLMEAKGKEGTLKFTVDKPGPVKVRYKRIGKHKPSILQSLGVDDPSPLAERWIKVTGKFYEFVHRHGAWKSPHSIEDFESIWRDFEDVLADLVGNYLDLLITVVDRILDYEKPTDEIRGVLPHLLKSDMRRKYFFENLPWPAWLQPLKEDGWFEPESNVIVRPNQTSVIKLDWDGWWKPIIDSGWFDAEPSSFARTSARTTNEYNTVLPWHALEYAERIAEHTKKHPCAETINTLVEIIDTIVDCAENTREKITEDWALGQRIIKIISTLPEERKKDTHLTFMRAALEYQDKNVNVTAVMRYAHRLIESIEQNTNPALRELLSNNSRAERIKFLEQVRESIDKKNNLTEQGLANVYKEYVVVILQRFTSCLSVSKDALSSDQCATLSGLLTALHDQKKINWEALLGFIHELLSLEHFWVEQEVNGFKYWDQIFADAAELIAIGTNNDNHAFDPQLLPLVEKILLVLVEKAESSRTIKETPLDTFMNSSKGMVFWTMMEYALYFARTRNPEQADFRWPQAIRMDFTKRLDKNVESSFEFSFALGAFLPQLLYFDKKWVIDNIDCIFPIENEYHWYVTFSIYLLSSDEIHESLYYFLKEDGHYQKALNTNFAYHDVETKLAKHICTFWLENDQELNDETGLIYQVLNSKNPNFLSAVIHFFSNQRDNLSEEDRVKIRSAWRVMFDNLSQNKDEKVYQKVLDKLSKWVVFIDIIDEEALEWLKLSVRYITWDIRILVETLLTHVSETPREVGIIYLELSERGIGDMLGSLLDQDKAIETVRILYEAGCTEAADQICIQFAEDGLNFLKPLYNEYQH